MQEFPHSSSNASQTDTRSAADLLKAAVHAMQDGSQADAIQLLTASVAAAHVNPLAHYLLGAEFAQSRRYGDAVLHMTTAIEQSPELWEARLQLGLLWLTLQNPTAALSQLSALSALPIDNPLRSFGEGLISLAQGSVDDALTHLAAGLLARTDNPALMADMRRLKKTLEAQVKARASLPGGQLAVDTAAISHGLAISAYNGGNAGR